MDEQWYLLAAHLDPRQRKLQDVSDPPSGVRTRIAVDRVAGLGPWAA